MSDIEMIGFFSATALVVLIVSCAATRAERDIGLTASYGIELRECLSNSQTRAEFDRCANAVDRRYGIVETCGRTDGGVP